MKTRRTHRDGFSLIELLIVVAIILIIAAIAIPSLMRSKIAANEASAVGSLHAMNNGLALYASTYSIGFPASLSNLGPAATPTSTAADLIDVVLISGLKSGYTFTYTPGSPDANGTISSYTIHADPTAPNRSGTRGFFTDQTLVTRFNPSGAASVSDSPLN